MSIIEPQKKETYSAPSNCYDNWTIRQVIYYQPPSDKEKLPWIAVGQFCHCLKRYSSFSVLPQCASCRNETTTWSRHIKFDKRYSSMIGGVVNFINKKLAQKSTFYTIFPEDIVASKGQQKEEEVLP